MNRRSAIFLSFGLVCFLLAVLAEQKFKALCIGVGAVYVLYSLGFMFESVSKERSIRRREFGRLHVARRRR